MKIKDWHTFALAVVIFLSLIIVAPLTGTLTSVVVGGVACCVADALKFPASTKEGVIRDHALAIGIPGLALFIVGIIRTAIHYL